MAGPIQKSISGAINTASAIAVAGKKLNEDAQQAKQEASLKAEAEAKATQAIQKEAKEASLEADLIRLGADPESASAYMKARALGLDTKSFGMIRKQGKFVGSYSSLAEKLSKDALTDSLSSKVINQKGFAQRVFDIASTRRGRVDALVTASKGGKK